MPRFVIDWVAECLHCGHEIDSADMVEFVPDDLPVKRCSYCSEELCDGCRDLNNERIHAECQEELAAEEEREANE